MLFIRTVHISKFSGRKGRFDNCFSNHHGGVSIFEKECAISCSGDICTHIHKFYQSTVFVPIIYCEFSKEECESLMASLSGKPKPVFKSSKSDNGDDCHLDISGVSSNQIDKLSGFCTENLRFRLCDTGNALVWDEDTKVMLLAAKEKFELSYNS